MLTRNPYILLLLLASFCLFSAYFVEYIMQLAACPLCIYQRFPYLIFIFVSIIALTGREYKQYNTYLVITSLGAIVLAGYHTGIERGIFELSSLCKPLISVTDNISVQDFTKLLYNQKIAMCNKPALVVFNLSMVEWNLLLNIILLVFFIKYRNFRKNKLGNTETMPKPFFNDTHSKKIEEIIRVNHAGEFGAQKIYQGQIKYCKNPDDQKILKIMLDQEQKHLEYFSNKIQKGFSRPTIFMPLWSIGGYSMGAMSAKISLKAAMVVTENVEAVIEEHYAKQINYLETHDSKNPMLKKIKKFQADEIEHKDIAITHIQGNSNILDNLIGNCIKTICRGAIFLSKKL